MMKVDFRTLLLQLMPTFLRVGVLKGFCNAVAMVLQRSFNDTYVYVEGVKQKVVWISERKAMRERLNLVFRGVSYDESDKLAILVEDGYDVTYPIAYNNNEFVGEVMPEDKRLIMTDTEDASLALIVWNVEDKGAGCNLSVVIPVDGTGNLSIVYGNLMALKNEVNRLIFAGLLCKFYRLRRNGNNEIKEEI